MRNRGALVAAVAAFALGVVGLAVVVGGGGDDSSLPKLLYAADAGAASDEAGTRSASAMLAPVQAVEYKVSGSLPALPEEAPAYRLGGDADEADLAELAKALGVEPSAITVAEEPGRPWVLAGAEDQPVASDAGADTGTATATAQACPPCPPDADCAACGAVEPVPDLVDRERPADLPTQAEAEAIARPVFEALGLPTDKLGTLDNFYAWTVTVAPSVGGLRTIDYVSTLAIGPKGVIQWGSGFLGSPEEVGDYPLVDAEVALDRLRNGVGIGPRTLTAGAEPALDSTVPIKPTVVEVTGAHLALQHMAGSLLPVVVFESADGHHLGPVPAVEDRFLDQATPADDPRPDPTGDGSGCTVAGRAGSDDGDNAPLTVEVCGPTHAEVGEEVTFEVAVTDPDALIYSDTCEGPWAEYGDGEPTVRTTCAVVCKEGRRDDRTPGKHAGTWRYTYAKAGTFTATFHYRSGPCTSGASEGTGKHTIVVN
jgi:hypothetical protein